MVHLVAKIASTPGTATTTEYSEPTDSIALHGPHVSPLDRSPILLIRGSKVGILPGAPFRGRGLLGGPQGRHFLFTNYVRDSATEAGQGFELWSARKTNGAGRGRRGGEGVVLDDKNI